MVVLLLGEKKKNGGKIPGPIENVKMIFSTLGAFVALFNDGRVLAWGDKNFGGKISDKIKSQLRIQAVKIIIPSEHQFTALCENGEMFTWPEKN